MRTGICITLKPADHRRLAALVRDRNAPHKHVWCAESQAAHARRRSFPDAQPALNLAAARLRHIAGTAWSTKRYLNIELLKDQQMRG